MTYASSQQNKWGTLISASLSCFVAFIDFAIVNTAIPAIQQNLSSSVIQLQWMINAFVLAVSILIVTMGRIGDLFGRRFVNMCGVALFGISSLLAGLTSSSEWLIVFRLLQGVAAAAILPSSLALISHAFPQTERGKAIGIWGGITGFGLAAGPVLGGILVGTLNWRWIFFINVPITIISLLLNFFVVKESHADGELKKIDLKGFFLLTLGLGSLVFGLMHAPDWGWASILSLSLFAIAIISLICFYFSERKSPYPTIPFHLFSNRIFFCCAFSTFSMLFFITAAFFLMPLYLQTIRHESPFVAGLMLLPITGCVALFSPVVGHLTGKISAKTFIVLGLFFLIFSAFLQTLFHLQSTPWPIVFSFFIMGIGWALARNPATIKAMASVPHQFAGTTTGVLWTLANVGGSVGLAICGTVFRRVYESTMTEQSFLTGYHYAMWILAALSLVTSLVIWFVMKEGKVRV